MIIMMMTSKIIEPRIHLNIAQFFLFESFR